MYTIARKDFKKIIDIRNNLYDKDLIMAVASLTDLISSIESNYRLE